MIGITERETSVISDVEGGEEGHHEPERCEEDESATGGFQGDECIGCERG